MIWIEKEVLFAAVGDQPFSSGQCFYLPLDAGKPFKKLYLFGDVNAGVPGDPFSVIADLNLHTVERANHRVREGNDEVEQTIRFTLGSSSGGYASVGMSLNPATHPPVPDSVQIRSTAKHALASSLGPTEPILLPFKFYSQAAELEYCLLQAVAGTALVNRFYAYIGIYQSPFAI